MSAFLKTIFPALLLGFLAGWGLSLRPQAAPADPDAAALRKALDRARQDLAVEHKLNAGRQDGVTEAAGAPVPVAPPAPDEPVEQEVPLRTSWQDRLEATRTLQELLSLPLPEDASRGERARAESALLMRIEAMIQGGAEQDALLNALPFLDTPQLRRFHAFEQSQTRGTVWCWPYPTEFEQRLAGTLLQALRDSCDPERRGLLTGELMLHWGVLDEAQVRAFQDVLNANPDLKATGDELRRKLAHREIDRTPTP